MRWEILTNNTTMLDLTKKLQTRDGQPIEIKFTDGRGEYPILGYVGDSKTPDSWTIDGKYMADSFTPSDLDLINAPEWHLPDPPEGYEWHRNDWTEEMLPEGWRPLLLGESVEVGDDVWLNKEYGWNTSANGSSIGRNPLHPFARTRRPLPPPKPKLREVQLCADDVLPGSVIRPVGWSGNQYVNFEAVVKNGIRMIASEWGEPIATYGYIPWQELEARWQINRSISLTGKWDAAAWEKCSKMEEVPA